MRYTNEKSNVELDVIVMTPEEYELYNRIFRKAVQSRSPRISSDYIKNIDRLTMTDSLNNVEFIIKTVAQNAIDEKKEEDIHERIEKEYQQQKAEKYSNNN